jgi:hypothetical protein
MKNVKITLGKPAANGGATKKHLKYMRMEPEEFPINRNPGKFKELMDDETWKAFCLNRRTSG